MGCVREKGYTELWIIPNFQYQDFGQYTLGHIKVVIYGTLYIASFVSHL